MDSLYLLLDTRNYGYNAISLFISAICSIIFGVAVLISKNPIVSILFLIGLFLTVAIYLMLIGLNFIALSYLLVYVGAISILFIFILMLINIRISEIFSASWNSIPSAIFVGSLIFYIIPNALPYFKFSNLKYILISETEYSVQKNKGYNINGEIINFENPFSNNITKIEIPNLNYKSEYTELNTFIDILKTPFIFFKNMYDNINIVVPLSWEKLIAEITHINSLGNIIYTNLFIYLLLTSMILLLCMVGCIIINVKES